MTNQPLSNSPAPTPDGNYVTPLWGKTTRTIMTVFFIAGLVLGIIMLSPVFQVLFLAFIFALILFIPARSIAKYTPFSYKLAVLILYLFVVILLIFAVLVLIPSIIEGINSLLAALQVAYNNFILALEAYQPSDGVIQLFGFSLDLDPFISPMRDLILGITPTTITTGTNGAPQIANLSLSGIITAIVSVLLSITSVTASFIVSAAGFVVTFGFALLVSFLLLIELPSLRTNLKGWVSSAYEREFTLLLYHLDQTWEGFLKSQVIIGIIQGLSSFIIFYLLGLPGAGILAFLTGTLGLIPSVGGIIAGIPIAVVSLLLGSYRFPEMSHFTFTLIVFAINGTITQVIFAVVSPLIMSNQVKLSTIVIIVGLAVGLSLGGILGALLVVPVMGSIKVIFSYILNKLTNREPFPNEPMPVGQKRGFFSQTYQMYTED